MDDNQFFREATVRICSNLAIEQAMAECLHVIEAVVPVDSLWLELLEPKLASMRLVAKATESGGEALDLLVPLPPPATQEMRGEHQRVRQDREPAVQILNRPRESPVSAALLDRLGEPLSSCLGLPLVFEGKEVGVVVLLAEGEDRYTEEHAKRLALLREPFTVATMNFLQHQEIRRLRDRLEEDNRQLYRELHQLAGDRIIGAEFGLRDVMEQVTQVAGTASPVLLLGETGVGKDVIAHAIHDRSPRRNEPFVTVNCGAIPESLVDSEIFGHEKGAFTGAISRKRGRFERANGGTIFLDEVGELPAATQVRLLRVLQNRELERVGGTQTVALDIRVIAATNRDLEEMVKEGTFRRDLWFRLHVFPIVIPPLRDRTQDIPALLQFFIERKAQALKLSKTPALMDGALEALRAYHWPGNVRELENLVERTLILYRAGDLRPDLLLPDASGPVTPSDISAPVSPLGPGTPLTLDELNRRHIQQVLELTGGQVHGRGGAAELLGINASTLRSRMKKLGLTR